jgi:UDP-glucose 4-epimerase
MRTLVTGGAGFIGSALVDRLLAEGHSVDALDDLSTGSLANLAAANSSRGGFRFELLDICDKRVEDLIVARAPEVIFHLAAQASVANSVVRPRRDAEVNVVGTLRVLDAAARAGVERVVYAASGGTLYGDLDAAELPVAEEHPYAPLTPYAISKRTAVDYLAAYRDLHGLSSCALALANVYGPRQDPSGEAGVVAIFSHDLVNGRTSVIHGDGSQTRDFVYVADAVDAFVRAGSSEVTGVVNIGTGTQTSVATLHRLLHEIAGHEGEARFAPARTGDVRHSALDPTRAQRTLGWSPVTTLASGLRAVLDEAVARSLA